MKPPMKSLAFILLCTASLSACAQSPAPAAATTQTPATTTASKIESGTPEARARDAILKLSPRVTIEQIGPAPIPGFRQVIVSGQVIYVSDDGHYMLHGTLIDLENSKNLSEAVMADLREELLAKIPHKDRIVFAPPNPKYTVSVFTDVECGFCRKFHSQIGEYNAQGIAVEYLAFPRMGIGSPDFDKMVAVWCADDRKQALTRAKNDHPPKSQQCTSPVRMQYDLGQRMGLTGTPMILAADGTQLGGYLPPAQLRAALDAHAAEVAAVSATAAQGG